jgi:hypothetical protein
VDGGPTRTTDSEMQWSDSQTNPVERRAGR